MTGVSVLDRAWALGSEVSVRPERFGALLYHHGSRRLSFLKDPRLLLVVESLAVSDSAWAACVAVGIPDDELPAFERALGRLVDTRMVEVRA